MSLSGFIPMKSLPSAPPPNESVVLFARDLSVGIKSVTEQDELVETLQADVQAKERALAKLEEAKAKLLGEMTSAQATGEAEKDTEKKKVAKPSLNEQYGTLCFDFDKLARGLSLAKDDLANAQGRMAALCSTASAVGKLAFLVGNFDQLMLLTSSSVTTPLGVATVQAREALVHEELNFRFSMFGGLPKQWTPVLFHEFLKPNNIAALSDDFTKPNIAFYFSPECTEWFRRSSQQVPELAAIFNALATRAKAPLPLWPKPVFHFVGAVVIGADRSFIIEVGQTYNILETEVTIAAMIAKPTTSSAVDAYVVLTEPEGRFYLLSLMAFKQLVVEHRAVAPKSRLFPSADEFAQMVLDGCAFLVSHAQTVFTERQAMPPDGKVHWQNFMSAFAVRKGGESAKKKLKTAEEPSPQAAPLAVAAQPTPAQQEAIAQYAAFVMAQKQ
jgi:hypothetical protein